MFKLCRSVLDIRTFQVKLSPKLFKHAMPYTYGVTTVLRPFMVVRLTCSLLRPLPHFIGILNALGPSIQWHGLSSEVNK